MSNSKNNSETGAKTIQEQTKILITTLVNRGYSLELLQTLDFQQLQRAVDTTANKTYSAKPSKVSTSTGIHIRFIDHINSIENKRMTYDEVLTWLMTDMCPDTKTWFGQSFEEVVKERQLYDMGLNPEFNEGLYIKMNTRAKNRVNTHICHESDTSDTSNKTVNIELKKRGLSERCKLVKSGSIPVAVVIE